MKLCLILRTEFERQRTDFIIRIKDGNIAIYLSEMGMIGALVLELNDQRIIKSELNTIVAAGGGAGWESSGDLRVRGICNKTKMDLSVHAGTVVNTIVVDGARFGANSGGEKIDVPLEEGETIIALEYGIDKIWVNWDHEGSICGLYFVTNTFKYHGPYSGRVMLHNLCKSLFWQPTFRRKIQCSKF